MSTLSTTQPAGQRVTLLTTDSGPLDARLIPDASTTGAQPGPIPGVDDGGVTIAGTGGAAGLLTYVKGTIVSQLLAWSGTTWAASLLNVFYQTVEDQDGATFQDPALQFGPGFTVLPGPPTRVNLTRQQLPSVGVGDAQERLAVTAGGLWDAAANGFLGFATTALRDAYPGLRTAGMLSFVSLTQCLYMLAADLTTWDFYTASPALARQAAWAVDGAAGSDNNSGAPGSPLATSEELNRRLCLGGQQLIIQQSTTVAFAAGAYKRLQLNLAAPIASGFSFKTNCAFTSTANMTLSAVVNTNSATNVRGQITVGTGALTNKSRIRSVSGAATGAIAYSTGQNVSAQNHFVTQFFNYSTGATVNIANGTDVVVDTLAVSFTEVDVTFAGNSSSSDPAGFFELHDAQILRGATFVNNAGDVQASLVNVVGCELTGGFEGTAGYYQCRKLGAIEFHNGAPYFFGCDSQTTNLAFWEGINASYLSGNAFDGGGLLARNGAVVVMGGTTEWENGTAGTAVQTSNYGNIAIGAKMWGNATAPGAVYAVGYTIGASSSITTSSASFAAIPSTVLISMAGQSFSATDIPVVLTELLCGFTLNSVDAQAVSTTGNTLRFAPAARGNLAATTLLAATTRAGTFRVTAYFAVTATGGGAAGAPLVRCIWTDDSGVVQTQIIPFTVALNAAVLGGSGGSIIIETNGATVVQVDVIGVTVQGSLQWSLRATARIETPN